MSPGYAYIATPYTSHPLGQDKAYQDANEAAARLFDILGQPVFSPIGHSHSLCSVYGTKDGLKDHLDGEFWKAFDKPFLDAAEVVVVVMMPGWEVSHGIAHEVAEARIQKKVLLYYTWPELKLDRAYF